MAVEDTWHLKDGSRSKRYGRGLRYRVRYRGVPTRSFRTKGEADRYWLKIRTEQPEPERPDATVAELVDRWLATKRGLSPKGYEACRDAAKVVRTDLGDWMAADLTTEQVQAWIGGLQVRVKRRPDGRGRAEWQTRPASESQRRKVLQALAGALKLVGLGTCDEVRVTGRTSRDAHFLTMQELQRLAVAAGDYSTMILFMGVTGVRIGEACGLDVRDVDPARRRARVRKSKNGRPRDVPVPRSVLDGLDLDRPGSEPLFLAPAGGRVGSHNWRSRIFRTAAERAELLPLRPHDLRHTAASLAIAARADVKAVQAMLGHRSAVMTLDLYGHLFDRSLDAVADRLGDQLDAASGYTSGTHADGR